MKTKQFHFELPHSYEENSIVLMVRDPYCLFAYWDLSPDLKHVISKHFNCSFDQLSIIIQLFEIDDQGKLNIVAQDNVNAEMRSYYLHNVLPDCFYQLILGVKAKDGQVYQVLTSNNIHTPAVKAGPSKKKPISLQPLEKKTTFYFYQDSDSKLSFS